LFGYLGVSHYLLPFFYFAANHGFHFFGRTASCLTPHVFQPLSHSRRLQCTLHFSLEAIYDRTGRAGRGHQTRP